MRRDADETKGINEESYTEMSPKKGDLPLGQKKWVLRSSER